MNPENNIERFTEAQLSPFGGYDVALREVQAGRKVNHWIWYIFPQMRGLGHSMNSYFYGITDADEARNYLSNPILGARLRAITLALLAHADKTALAIFGDVDAQKVCSSMTLFDAVSPNDIFARVLDIFYGGRRCVRTIEIISK